MATYLLIWNPNRWAWDDLQDDLDDFQEHGYLTGNWSCGNTKRIQAGDRLFLMRLGLEPRGIVGSGHAQGSPFEAASYDPERAARGDTALYVDFVFDTLVEKPLIAREELDAPSFEGAQWSPRSSGVTIPEPAAAALEALWAERTSAEIPEELPPGKRYREGTARTILVNAYERDRRARDACVAHYGPGCVVCGFTSQQVYGVGAGHWIVVHHLVPVSEIGRKYEVDPVKDLRPVCPNCHAMIHRTSPPSSIEDVRRMFRAARQ